MKGKVHSMTHRQNLSEAMTGKVRSKETRKRIAESKKGDKNPNFGKHFSDAHKRKIGEANSKSLIGKQLSENHKKNIGMSLQGEKHPNWKGGISFEPYPCGWTGRLKDAIRQRDEYRCVLCGAKQDERKLPVHHIDYDKENLDPKNLVTLCVSCHSKTNTDRFLWSQHFRSLVEEKGAMA
jgi:hypothetical protein